MQVTELIYHQRCYLKKMPSSNIWGMVTLAPGSAYEAKNEQKWDIGLVKPLTTPCLHAYIDKIQSRYQAVHQENLHIILSQLSYQ
jgi:hypothetical protein